MSASSKSVPQLYRDSLRLIRHIAGNSPKAQNLRQVVGQEFRRSADETDENKIEALKYNAVRALSNYLLYEAAAKDEQMQRKIKNWESRQLKDD
mmetsp:Transcript_8860/g.15607  ORF Transcript_8860/g.15607 Transcript_8860/m.15607 type:complete len:94 (+) Transcript_8860:201-482(+)